MRSKLFFIVFILSFLSFSHFYIYSENSQLQKIDKWLVLGPAQIPGVEKEVLKNEKSILKFNFIPLSLMRPLKGERVEWLGNKKLYWRVLENPRFSSSKTQILYFATYIENFKWLQTKLLIENIDVPISIFLDGNLIETSKSGNKISAGLNLINTKHILILKVVLPKDKSFKLSAFLENKKPFGNEISLTPYHRLNKENILNIKNVRKTAVSPDGKLVAVFLTQIEEKRVEKQSWVEVLSTQNGRTLFSSKNFAKIKGFKWLNDSISFSYIKTKKEISSVFIYNLNNNRQKCLIREIKNLSTLWWANNNSFFIYSVYTQRKDKEGYRNIKEIIDRAEFSGRKYSMYIYYINGGVTHKISDFEENFESVFISPDSKKVLFMKEISDNKNRPYHKFVSYLFYVNRFHIKRLIESNWLYNVSWSPDSRKLLILGGPSSFKGIGNKLKKDIIPNDYDIQAFLYDLNTKKAEPISKDFNPSIDFASWNSFNKNIYFCSTDGSYTRIFKFSPKKRIFKRINTPVEVVRAVSFSKLKNIAVYWGSGCSEPFKLYKLNLSSGKSVVLKDYNKKEFKYVKLGKVENWNFKTKEGKTIIGRIYYPLNFDKNKKYPCIVYYYGGTSPVTRDFGGRYPKNWYAAKGYIVYVLQPSGAIGFGQEFSSIHVNDWGEVTSKEIIYGVKELIRCHKYIDPKRIGAIGASYGGFLTQYLAAQTDIFSAFISHAGISSLTSYWGVGDWGYDYSGVATANSFPWNRKDIYVGHSPLYMADRINKPLLLLHGAIDNNVPPGESYQMFAALKLLEKEVALVTFNGEQHFIMGYKKRVQWMRTIIAWFDKWLKDEPEHWDYMYKK